MSLASRPMYFASGTMIRKFPANGHVFVEKLLDQGGQVLKSKSDPEQHLSNVEQNSYSYKDVAILGVTEKFGEKSGRIGIYGDSNCLDSAHLKKDCYWLLDQMISNLHNPSGQDFLNDLHLWDDAQVHTGEVPFRLTGNHLYRHAYFSI